MSRFIPHRTGSRPTVIPTPFARLHADIASCRDVADLMDVALRIIAPMSRLSTGAQRDLQDFANRRFLAIRDQEQAA